MSHEGFPRRVRLRRPAEFTRVYRQGRRLAAGCVQLRYGVGQTAEPRLGLAIAKRVLPRAVDRNRVKRVIRESFRRQRESLPAADIVIALRGTRQRQVPADLEQCLDRVWDKLRNSSPG